MGEDQANHQVPSPGVRTLLASQGTRDPLLVDTSFTFEQHLDESMQFLPAAVPLIAAGKSDITRLVAIDDYLNDPQRVLIDDNARAARQIDKNIAALKRETGLRDDEIVRLPVLFGSADLLWGGDPGSGYRPPLTALLPNAINGVILNRHSYLAPRQWGPTIAGTDVLAHAVTAAYRAAGMGVTFIDGWRYSLDGGDVHCATNVLRDDTATWWRDR